MEKSLPVFILLLTALTTALSAGLFYAYACSVNPGLHNLPDEAYIAAMQSINRAILNPVFFFQLFGLSGFIAAKRLATLPYSAF